jgi:hypothetical protein
MVRPETLARHGLAFDESVGIGADVILWIDVARRYKILGIDRTLTKVTVHERNAFSDPWAQYRGGMVVLRHAFSEDADLGFAFRRRALAGVCSSAGHLLLQQGQRNRALRLFARAAAYWPLDLRTLSLLSRLLLPARIRTVLKRLRGAVRGSDYRPRRDHAGKR